MLSSPPSPIRVPLTISTVTNALVKLRRSTSKAEIIDFTSGEPKTHSSLQGEGATSSRKVPVEQNDLFSCMGAVDVPKLLRGSRASLLERAEFMGANVLVDERCVRLCKVLVFLFADSLSTSWECSIRTPRDRRHGFFKVHVRYSLSSVCFDILKTPIDTLLRLGLQIIFSRSTKTSCIGPGTECTWAYDYRGPRRIVTIASSISAT